MGIKNLLPQLKDITLNIHLKDYRGKKVGVDGYVWLHQKSHWCATDICLQKPTNAYVRGFIKEVQLLLNFGVIPVIVFDGTYLPLKERVEQQRAAKREKSLELGKKLLAEGKTDEAFNVFSKAVDITPQMAFEVILKLKQMNVQYYVAPYEADAQLAYLYKTKHIDAVISIDSDLLPFGCHRLLTKYSKGWVKEVSLTKLNQNFDPLDFSQFSFEMFLQFCIFCGCDYLASIPGIGPKKAHYFMLKGKQWNSALKHIRFNGKYRVPSDYEKRFKQALYTFRHQRVYDPQQKRLVHLQPLPPDQPDIDAEFLGAKMEPNIAQQIAEGIIDPITKETLVPQTQPLSYGVSTCSNNTIWKKRLKKKEKTQSNTLFSYLNKKKKSENDIPPSISPPIPAAVFERSFEKNKATIQLISDQLELFKAKTTNTNNAAVEPKHFMSFNSFAFRNTDSNNTDNRNTNRRNNVQIKNEDEYDALQLSETQAIESIRNRQQFAFKKEQESKESSSEDDDLNNVDVMNRFAFGNTSTRIDRKNPSKTAKNARKRPREELLPSKPIQSMDYTQDSSIDSSQCTDHEAKPHQFRPPRMRFKENRAKRRRLHDFQHKTHHFESKFIPKEAGSLALCTNTSIVPQVGLSAFVLKKSQTKNDSNIAPAANINSIQQNEYESQMQIEVYQAPNEEKTQITGHILEHRHAYIPETQDPDAMEDIETLTVSSILDDTEFEEQAENFLDGDISDSDMFNKEDEDEDIDILAMDNDLRLSSQISQSPAFGNDEDCVETIDLTNSEIEDNPSIHEVISLIEDDDDEQIDLNDDCVALSRDEDKENDSLSDNLSLRPHNKESPLKWKKKLPKASSPDLFDTECVENAFSEDAFDADADILSQDIKLTIHENVIENEDDFESFLNNMDDDSLVNVLEDNELNIDTVAIDAVINNPVQPSWIRKGHQNRRQRHKRKLRLQDAEDNNISNLEENDYFL